MRIPSATDIFLEPDKLLTFAPKSKDENINQEREDA
jgi:hypothetical protein